MLSIIHDVVFYSGEAEYIFPFTDEEGALSMPFKEGDIIIHINKTDWGLGKILLANGNKVRILFAEDGEKACRDFKIPAEYIQYPSDQMLEENADCVKWLEFQPPYVDGKNYKKTRYVSFDDALQSFRGKFPDAFRSSKYMEKERNYKVAMHDEYESLLGNGKAQDLIARSEYSELVDHVRKMAFQHNLLFRINKAAFSNALKDFEAAKQFSISLFPFIDTPNETTFKALLDSIERLSVKGKTNPANWPSLTLIPYLANPNRHMYLQPEKTKNAASFMRYRFRYKSTLNWDTYDDLLNMSAKLLDILRPYGAVDYIDVQSFLWVCADMKK